MSQMSQNEILCITILPVFSQFLWSLKFIFSGSRNKLSLVLLQIANYIYSPCMKSVKKNEVWLKIFCYKDFVHWELKLLSFLMDSVLTRWYLIAKLNSFENRKTRSHFWDVDTSRENSLGLSIKLRAVIYISHFTPFYYFLLLDCF